MVKLIWLILLVRTLWGVCLAGAAAGAAVTVCVSGSVMVEAGGAITAGDQNPNWR